MKDIVPNVVAYPLNEARRLVEGAGYQIVLKAGGSRFLGKGQLRVIRQRRLDEKRVELTFASEMYEDLTSISKGG